MSETRRHCANCGARLHGAFCSECGHRAGQRPAEKRATPWPWVLVGVSLLALVGTIVTTRRGGGAAPAAVAPVAAPVAGAAGLLAASPETPLDLSTMTPVEQFDRLFDRVMRASEGGDAASVTTYAPLAMAAFAALPSPDVDARFHAGLIRLASGDVAAASAFADAIAREHPAHLFGILLKGKIAEQRGDAAAVAAAHREFLAAYPAETAAARPEYPGHQGMIDRFLKDATPPAVQPGA